MKEFNPNNVFNVDSMSDEELIKWFINLDKEANKEIANWIRCNIKKLIMKLIEQEW